MTTTPVEGYDLWDEPVEQITAARTAHQGALATAAVEPLWPYLSAARSVPEFEHRLALSEPNITRVLASVQADQARQQALEALRSRYTAQMDQVAAQQAASALTAALSPREAAEGAWGLYVTHRSGGHVDVLPGARFAEKDEAVRAARFYAGNFKGNDQISGVATKQYPGSTPTTTVEEFSKDPRRFKRQSALSPREAAGPIKWSGASHMGADYLVGKVPDGSYEVYYNPNSKPTPCTWAKYGPQGDTGPNSSVAHGKQFATMAEAMKDAESHAAQGKTSAVKTSGETAQVMAYPMCDICKAKEAHYDGKTVYGPWAFMCEDDFKKVGVGLGTGQGQRLVLAETGKTSAKNNGTVYDSPADLPKAGDKVLGRGGKIGDDDEREVTVVSVDGPHGPFSNSAPGGGSAYHWDVKVDAGDGTRPYSQTWFTKTGGEPKTSAIGPFKHGDEVTYTSPSTGKSEQAVVDEVKGAGMVVIRFHNSEDTQLVDAGDLTSAGDKIDLKDPDYDGPWDSRQASLHTAVSQRVQINLSGGGIGLGVFPVETVAIELAKHLTPMTGGSMELVVNGHGYTVYYDQQGALGDNGFPVEGDAVGDFEVFRGLDGPIGLKDISGNRVHVSPFNATNSRPKSYAAEQIGRAIANDVSRQMQYDSLDTEASLHTAETNPPYYIEQRGGKYVVVNDEGKIKGTFDTKEEARQQQKALYANVPGAAEKAKEDHGDPKPKVQSSMGPAVTALLQAEGLLVEAEADRTDKAQDDGNGHCKNCGIPVRKKGDGPRVGHATEEHEYPDLPDSCRGAKYFLEQEGYHTGSAVEALLSEGASQDDWREVGLATEAVNENAEGTGRYQNTPDPARPDWISEWGDPDSLATAEMTEQGRVRYNPPNPFTETLTTVRQAALRILAADLGLDNPPDPSLDPSGDPGGSGANLDGTQQASDFAPTDQQPTTTRPRSLPDSVEPDPASQVQVGTSNDVGMSMTGRQATRPTAEQRVAARVARLTARVLADNPTMDPQDARALAAHTVATYPEMVG